MEIVTSASGKILNYLLDATGRQLGYLVHYKDNIHALSKQVKKLKDSRERVKGKIDAAYRNGEITEPDVETWIAEVDVITSEADKFLNNEDEANKRCLKGWCIDLRSRYRLGKEAWKKTKAINELQKEGHFETLSHPAPLPRTEPSILGFSGAFESRKLIMRQVMEALKDENVSMIGICGMGGVGKTTLMKDIGKQAREEKLFDEVVTVVVSQTPDITKIQKDIAYVLGLSLPDADDKLRSAHLRERLKKEQRILVILDDVWGRIEVENIGIPFGINHKGCKIMFTSRNKDVCNQMDTQETFELRLLSNEESWVLFREAAGPNVEDSDINPIAMSIAGRCGGLPIALVTIARALKNKSKYVWADAERQLKKSIPTNISGMHTNVVATLELSFNYLESEEAKSFFLFCSLYPEDYCIPLEELVRFGMGLKWFEDVDTVEGARDRAHTIVSTLTSSFLLIADAEEKFVKMHDVVRDVALKIGPKYNHNFLVKAGIGLQKWLNGDKFEGQALTGISLLSNKISELPVGLECPKLQALLLQKNPALIVPNSFFEGMRDLKVLDMSNTELVPLPRSLQFLANLRTLCLNGCKLSDISLVKNLTNLEILSDVGQIRNKIRDLILILGILKN